MPGVKPKVGPKKMRSGGAAKKTIERKLPSGGGKKPVPKGNTGLAKLPKGVRNKMGFMSKGGAAKKKPVKKAKGGPAIGTEMKGRLNPAINPTLLDNTGLTQEQFANLTTAMDTRGKNRAYEKGSTDVGPPIDRTVYDSIATALRLKGKVPPEEIYPGQVEEPKGKARGGPVKKMRGGPVKKMRSGGAVKKMRSGGAVGCGAAKRGFGAVKRGR